MYDLFTLPSPSYPAFSPGSQAAVPLNPALVDHHLAHLELKPGKKTKANLEPVRLDLVASLIRLSSPIRRDAAIDMPVWAPAPGAMSRCWALPRADRRRTGAGLGRAWGALARGDGAGPRGAVWLCVVVCGCVRLCSSCGSWLVSVGGGREEILGATCK